MNIAPVFGYLAVLFTVMSFVPQVIKTIRSKSVKDLSLLTLIVFVCASSSWLVYGYLINDIPIIMTNAITVSLQILLLILKLRYTVK